MNVRKPFFKVLYNGTNITEDVQKYLISLRYTDKEEGESDEVEIELDDVDGLWRGPWYPDKGAKLTVTIGYDDVQLDCGTFEIDDIELKGAPDTVTIKALAAAISGDLRTKRSYAHEKKTLQQIARTVASKHGYQVLGTIPDVQFQRITQNRETDLGFLRRIAADYGCLFSVRDKTLVFTTIYEIEDKGAATTIDRLELTSYSFRDKTAKTYKDAKVTYHNPKDKEVVKTNYATSQEKNADGFAYTQIATGDTKTIYTKAENKQQAEQKAKAHLHKANSIQQEGSVQTEGNPLLIAGNNFTLTGMGKLSGKWHITESVHSFTKSEGYGTDASVKRVGKEGSQASTLRNKAKQDAQRNPSAVSVQSANVVTKENSDGFTYTQINP